MADWYVVLVTGSRDMSEASRASVRDRLQRRTDEAHELRMLAVVIHGACPHPTDMAGRRIPGRYSVDAIADEMVWDFSLASRKRGPDGKPRNAFIANIARRCQFGGNIVEGEGFPPKGRYRSGTRNCIAEVRRRGVPIDETEVS